MSKKDDFNRCSFVTAKEETKDTVKTAHCRERLYCLICGYCHKHCVEHTNLRSIVMELSQDKKAIAAS